MYSIYAITNKIMKEYTFEDSQSEFFARNVWAKEAFQNQFLKDMLSYQITQIRKKRNLTQLDLAKKAGTTQSVIARIESGNQNISMKTLQKLIFALDATLEIKA